MQTSRTVHCALALGLALLLLAGGGCARRLESTVTIHEDGRVVSESVMVVPREIFMAQLQAVENFRKQAEDDWDDDDAEDEDGWEDPDGWGAEEEADAADGAAAEAEDPAEAEADAAPAEPEPTLEERARTAFTAHQVEMDGVEQEFVSITEDEDGETVTVAFRMKFEEMRTFVQHAPMVFGQAGFSRLVAKETDEGRLSLELTTPEGRMVEMQLQRMKGLLGAGGFQGAWTFVFPGEVQERNLPETDGKTTSFALDAREEADFDALKTLMKEGVTVVADVGELEISGLDLDSAKMRRHAGRADSPMAKLPIEDAAPGYTAEALGVVTTTVRVFPEAKETLPPATLEMVLERGDDNGCVAQIRLHAPPERMVLGNEPPELLRAVDDQDRPVVAPEAEEERWDWVNNNTNENRSVQFEIPLALPARDAEAIEELEAKVVVHSFGTWKTFSLTDPAPDEEKVLKLDDLIEGATLTVLKRKDETEDNRRQGRVQIKLEGPKEVQFIKCELGVEHQDNVHSYESSSSSSSDGDRLERTQTINFTVFHHNEDAPKDGKLVLELKYPDELKRERVKFTVFALDLF